MNFPEILIAMIGVTILALVGWSTSSPTFSVLALIFIILLWGLILALAVLSAIAIYMPEYKSRVSIEFLKFLAKYNPSKLHVLGYVAVSYSLTIYLFAVAFRTISNFDSTAFHSNIDTFGTAIYFSIVTLATVGYGDIVPISGPARFLVSIEILSGVAYGVFFLSVIASFLRED